MARNAAGNNLGTAGNDFLWGKALVLGNGEYDNYVDMDSATVFDALRGYGGNDTIFGDIYYDGDDATEGDQIYGGDGDDVLYGDCGTDEPGWATSTNGAADVIYGDAGNDRIYGQAGGDNLYAGDGNDTIVGGIGSDNIVGGDGHDLIFVDLLSGLTAIAEHNLALGGSGNDQIIGGWGNDELYGMDDQDKLIGGLGDDKIEGGDGADNMSGGAGNDYLRGGGYYGTAADLGDTMLGEGGLGLSGGQARRLALARLFLHESTLWLLDEATEALNAQTAIDVLQRLRARSAGRSLLIATHLRREAALADRLVSLRDGRIVGDARRGTDAFETALAGLRGD